MKRNPMIKSCLICKALFATDCRVGDRQKVCRNLLCQQERKRLAQQKWLAANPGYFKGRYPQLKEQILEYQRQQKRDTTVKKSAIQDELTPFSPNFLKSWPKMRTIQDELTLALLEAKRFLNTGLSLLYKTS
jgi:hypothetical protein